MPVYSAATFAVLLSPSADGITPPRRQRAAILLFCAREWLVMRQGSGVSTAAVETSHRDICPAGSRTSRCRALSSILLRGKPAPRRLHPKTASVMRYFGASTLFPLSKRLHQQRARSRGEHRSGDARALMLSPRCFGSMNSFAWRRGGAGFSASCAVSTRGGGQRSTCGADASLALGPARSGLSTLETGRCESGSADSIRPTKPCGALPLLLVQREHHGRFLHQFCLYWPPRHFRDLALAW